jgi:hypothetical protein
MERGPGQLPGPLYVPAVIDDMRMLPQPIMWIPIWIGGGSESTLTHAARLDGWHGSRLSPEKAAPIVRRLPEKRPGSDFTILVEPGESALDDWLRAVERVGRAAEEVRT